MWAGDRVKTSNYTIDYWWEAENPNRDRQLGNPVASWVGQNAKTLDKKHAAEVIKLVVEQFPYLQSVEARHAQLQSARWTR
jgi:hypothetical protein